MIYKALSLAKLGFHVFPLEPLSKVPAIDGYPVKATRDPEQIKRWWTCPVTGFPLDRNIAISTTRFGDDMALLVVDVDNKGEKRGDEVLLALELEHDVPATWEAVTPTGGRHLIYVVDRPVKQGVNVLGDGLDVRSYGGYIVAPGSVTEKGEYRWKKEPTSTGKGVTAPGQ